MILKNILQKYRKSEIAQIALYSTILIGLFLILVFKNSPEASYL